MKECPKCKRKWPDTGKFCPFDGTPLAEHQKPAEPESLQSSKTQMIEVPADIAALKGKLGTAEAAKKPKKGFSETQWFMKALNPEDLEEVNPDSDLESATKKYEKTTEVATEVRKKFSLSETFRGHKKEPKDPAKSGGGFFSLGRKDKKKAEKPAEPKKPAPKK
jgi:hypothetical protein